MVLILVLLVLLIWLMYAAPASLNNKFFTYVMPAILILIAGFRYYVGVDYEDYKIMYEWGALGYILDIEPSWLVLQTALHSIGGTYNLWFLVISALTIVPITLGFKKMSPCLAFSWLFFVGSFLYVETFNTIRQYVAMGIIFYGASFILEGKYKYYVLCIIVAMLFHNSALAGLFLLVLNRQYPKWLMIATVMFTWLAGTYLLENYLQYYVYSFFESFVSTTNSGRTYEYDLTTHSAGLANSGILKIVYNMIAIGVVAFAGRVEKNKVLFLNAFVFAICWYNVFYIFQEMLRIYQYFFLFGTILFPLLVAPTRDRNIRFMLYAGIMSVFLLFNLASNWNIKYEENPTYALFEG